MKVTMDDIAEKAGVTKTTVSYVLNGSGSVSDEKREEILALVAELGYQSRRSRKASGGRKPGAANSSVVLAFPDLPGDGYCKEEGSLYLESLLASVEETLRSQSTATLVSRCDENGQLAQGNLDGTVAGVLNFGAAHETRCSDLPEVRLLSHSQTSESDRVEFDNAAAGHMAARRLLEAGCTSCAYVSPDPGHIGFGLRKATFTDVLQPAGVTVTPFEMDCTTDPSQADALAKAVCETCPDVDGIFIPGPDIQVAAIAVALQKQGMPPSTKLKIISCLSNIEILGPMNLGIEYMDIQLREIGKAGANTILWRMQNPDAAFRRIMIQPRLMQSNMA